MPMPLHTVAKTLIRKSLHKLGFTISRLPAAAPPAVEKPAWLDEDTPSYMDLAMVQAAEQAGIYIGDYAEAQWGEVGSARRAVDQLYLPHLQPGATVLEVGPGTGRYAKLMLEALPECKVWLYERDPFWQQFLTQFFAENPRVTTVLANGWTYPEVSDHSVDLYCANAVFVYTRPMMTFRNLYEAIRVVKPGGVIAFDFFDLDEADSILDFIETNASPGYKIWSLDSLSLFTHFMQAHGCQLEQTYQNKCHNYHSTYALFRKGAA